MDNNKLKPQQLSLTDFLLFIVVTIWGFNYVIVKVPLKEMSPLLFNTLRFAVGTIICWTIFFIKEDNKKVSKKFLLYLFFMGAVVHSLNQIAFIYGVAKTTAGATSIILAATPICVAFLSNVLKLEKADSKTWLGIGISFIGVILVVLGSGTIFGNEKDSIWGNLLIVVATVFWSIYTILIRLIFKDLSSIKVTTYSMTFATITFLIITSKQILSADWTSYSTTAWLGVLYSGVFVLGISYILWNMGINKVGPTKASIYTNLPPFISALAGWAMLGEKITIIQVLGGTLIIGGLIYINKTKKEHLTKESY